LLTANTRKGRLGVLGLLALLQWDREVLLGRRINDEVEMFEEGMKDVSLSPLSPLGDDCAILARC